MGTRKNLTILVLAFCLVFGAAEAGGAVPVGTAWTYQGRLMDANDPADGIYDFKFKLFDDPCTGSQQVGMIEINNLDVIDGYFTVELDFGSEVFNGDARWLDISVRPGEFKDPNSYTILSPRQQLTPTPYAIYSKVADTCPGSWNLTGNTDTSPPFNFIGTLDSKSFLIKVDGKPAVRIEPISDSGYDSVNNIIMGHHTNDTASGVKGAVISGGGMEILGGARCPNRVTAKFGTVGGGVMNQAGDSTVYQDPNRGICAIVAGGYNNTAAGSYSAIGGGSSNMAGWYWSTVAGGCDNNAPSDYSSIGGGVRNEAVGKYSTIGGGKENLINASSATIAGGDNNQANGSGATVAGGEENVADGKRSTVGGGEDNTAGELYSAICGGAHNQASGSWSFIGGGNLNGTGNSWAVVSGGFDNSATGASSMIPGGYQCEADGYCSFAAGYRAKARNTGCFVWADSTGGIIECTTDDRWLARASGGVNFYTNSSASSGCYIVAGGNSWNSISDRATKENFTAIDTQQILKKVAQIPIQEYNLKSQDASIRHIGPVAQDFHAAFGCGESNKAINMEDADGVLFAAVQGLYWLSEQQAEHIVKLEAQNATEFTVHKTQIQDLQKENAKLHDRLLKLEAMMRQLARRKRE